MVQETAVFLRFDPPFPLFDTEAPGWNKGTGPSYGGYKRPDQESHSRWMAGCIPNSRLVLIEGGTIRDFSEEKSSTWKRS